MLVQQLSDNSQISVRVSIFQDADKASPLYLVREFGNNCLLLSLDKALEYGDVLNISSIFGDVQTDFYNKSYKNSSMNCHRRRHHKPFPVNQLCVFSFEERLDICDCIAFSSFDHRKNLPPALWNLGLPGFPNTLFSAASQMILSFLPGFYLFQSHKSYFVFQVPNFHIFPLMPQ